MAPITAPTPEALIARRIDGYTSQSRRSRSRDTKAVKARRQQRDGWKVRIEALKDAKYAAKVHHRFLAENFRDRDLWKPRAVCKAERCPVGRTKRRDLPLAHTGRFPAYQFDIVDRKGRRGVFLKIDYDGAVGNAFGVCRRRIEYAAQSAEVLTLATGAPLLISNIAADVAEAVVAGDELEAFSRAERKNGKVNLNLTVRLPRGASRRVHERIVREFCQRVFGAHHLPYVAFIHYPRRGGAVHNPHAHITASFRPMVRRGAYRYLIGRELRTDLDGEAGCYAMRKTLAQVTTRAMQEAGFNHQYTHLSNAARGLAILPMEPLSKAESEAVLRGEEVAANERNRRRIEENTAYLEAAKTRWTASIQAPIEPRNALPTGRQMVPIPNLAAVRERVAARAKDAIIPVVRQPLLPSRWTPIDRCDGPAIPTLASPAPPVLPPRDVVPSPALAVPLKRRPALIAAAFKAAHRLDLTPPCASLLCHSKAQDREATALAYTPVLTDPQRQQLAVAPVLGRVRIAVRRALAQAQPSLESIAVSPPVRPVLTEPILSFPKPFLPVISVQTPLARVLEHAPNRRPVLISQVAPLRVDRAPQRRSLMPVVPSDQAGKSPPLVIASVTSIHLIDASSSCRRMPLATMPLTSGSQRWHLGLLAEIKPIWPTPPKPIGRVEPPVLTPRRALLSPPPGAPSRAILAAVPPITSRPLAVVIPSESEPLSMSKAPSRRLLQPPLASLPSPLRKLSAISSKPREPLAMPRMAGDAEVAAAIARVQESKALRLSLAKEKAIAASAAAAAVDGKSLIQRILDEHIYLDVTQVAVLPQDQRAFSSGELEWMKRNRQTMDRLRTDQQNEIKRVAAQISMNVDAIFKGSFNFHKRDIAIWTAFAADSLFRDLRDHVRRTAAAKAPSTQASQLRSDPDGVMQPSSSPQRASTAPHALSSSDLTRTDPDKAGPAVASPKEAEQRDQGHAPSQPAALSADEQAARDAAIRRGQGW